jgi:mannosyltransferase OCH1-like enzyme
MDYRLYTDSDARAVLARIGPQHVRAYEAVAVHAYRSDMLRAAVLFVHGGLYADADMVCLQSLRPLLIKAELVLVSAELVDNDLIYVRQPGHPLMLHYLNRMTANILGRAQCSSDLMLTGPGLFTECVREMLNIHVFRGHQTASDGSTVQFLHRGCLSSLKSVPRYHDAFADTAMHTPGPGTCVVEHANALYVCTKYAGYNQERLLLGGTDFAAEFKKGAVFTS